MQAHVPKLEVRAFGSRVKGKARAYSDLDLVLKSREPLENRTLEALKDAFSASRLPFVVEVMDWQNLSQEFQALIEQGYEVLQEEER